MEERRVFAVLLIIFLNLHAIHFIKSERILGVFLSPSKSHMFIHLAIADELSQAGHDVTVITGFPNVIKNATYKYIHLSNAKPSDYSNVLQNFISDKKFEVKQMLNLWEYTNEAVHNYFNDPLMKKFMQEHGPGSFDLLIVGYFFNDFQLGLGGHFKCPMILSWMIQPCLSVNKLVGNPEEVSYVPDSMSGIEQPMTFMNRVENMMAEISGQVLSIYFKQRGSEYYEKHFPADRYPAFEEVKKNISLIFVNHHLSQKPIRPYVPAMIEIGGIQIQEYPEPLSKDLADIFDQSQNGVIFFSLGSNVPASILNEERIQTIYKVFSQLPYTFIWKWSGRETPAAAKNIYFRDWLPQNSILNHPNLKLFITHAGGGSITESSYFGKPMLAFPLFGDQFANAEKAVALGLALQLDFHDFTEQILKDAILEMVEKPKYIENSKSFAKLYQDRPLKPRESVRYWSEYVLRHKGAKHLRSPAVDMNFIQLHSLDVFAFLFIILFLSIYLPIKICQYFYCRHIKQKVKKIKKN